ncbi:MAG: BON domain-containing protein [Gemmataceae bacterium]|jgi:osmotically-inducible protein OsmY|nr:BON domain-containing protein [Gemmataceae bacterium]
MGTLGERIEKSIRNHTDRHIQQLRVEILPGRVLLFGSTPKYFYKQIAQETVRLVCTGLRIENRIVVRKTPSSKTLPAEMPAKDQLLVSSTLGE